VSAPAPQGGDVITERSEETEAPPTRPVAIIGDRPVRAEGIDLIGEYDGSGYKEAPSLARRADGQVIQLTPLLYSIAEQANGERELSDIASAVGKEIGRKVTPDNVRVLIDNRLRPLGVLAAADGSDPAVSKPDPFLGLKFRAAVIPERASRVVGAAFKPLFFAPVWLGALVGLALTDYWVFFQHGVAQAMRQALLEPSVFLVGFAAVVISAAFHEIGHATGCRYGGADPGKMGCGLYLAWPAFYTDVTDAYRLDRRGRLRTDLGGVYFNVLFVLVTIAVYAATGWEPLLLLVVVEHLEIAHQMLPIVRLDGYYIVADLTGVPDLFARIKPILISALPWRKVDDKVKVLKPWVRVAVTAWVLIVVPLLLFQLLMILIQLPRILGTAWDSLGQQGTAIAHAYDTGNILGTVSGVIQVIVLVLPILGIVLMIARLGQRTVTGVWQRTEGAPILRLLSMVVFAGLVALLVYVWVPKGNYSPIAPGEKGTIQQGAAALRPRNLKALPGFVAPPPLDHKSTPAPTTTVPAPTTTVPARSPAVVPTTRALVPTTVASVPTTVAPAPRRTVAPPTTAAG